MNEASSPIIFFDGVCNLCNRWVDFVLRHDRREIFNFSSLQSEAASRLLKFDKKTQSEPTSVVLLQNGQTFFKSQAALKIIAQLNWPWKMLAALLIVPRFLRDFVYDFLARHRYQWFGRRDSCRRPTPELSRRFLEK